MKRFRIQSFTMQHQQKQSASAQQWSSTVALVPWTCSHYTCGSEHSQMIRIVGKVCKTFRNGRKKCEIPVFRKVQLFVCMAQLTQHWANAQTCAVCRCPYFSYGNDVTICSLLYGETTSDFQFWASYDVISVPDYPSKGHFSIHSFMFVDTYSRTRQRICL